MNNLFNITSSADSLFFETEVGTFCLNTKTNEMYLEDPSSYASNPIDVETAKFIKELMERVIDLNS